MDRYDEQSCAAAAARAAFITSETPFRTGLLKVGLSGGKESCLRKTQKSPGFLMNRTDTTTHFGKNHLGDLDKHLPSNLGVIDP